MRSIKTIMRTAPALIVLFALAGPPSASAQDLGLADRAQAFLKRYCFDCHGGPNDQGTRFTNALDPKVLLAKPANPKKPPFVIPGDPQGSLVWLQAGKAPFRMPPDDAEVKPGDDERKVLEEWIKTGAPFPKATGRKPLDDRIVLTTVRDHLMRTRSDDRPFQRYITLDHLHNNRSISDDQIRIHRAAVSKLLNSLSREREITRPEAVDAGSEVILHVDLQAYGWEPADWVGIEKAYPYGVLHVQDRDLLEIEQEIARLAATRLPIVRGDWFVATVSRPPLYDRLLRLPESLKELEKTLGVDLPRNFEQARLKRGRLITSGVSRHNRLVERHPTPFGAYWRSYDFKQSAGRGNLLEFPLGPRFPGNRFDDQAFEQAGGEVIFNLPNGLQGYMLADAKDKRFDSPAPVAIVSDRSETSGTPEIVNGLSCMACHASGMRTFHDEVRRFPGVFAEIRDQVERLHPPADEMDRLLAQDEDLFLRKLDEAVGPFLRSGELANADIRELVRRINEPIGAVARQYAGDLNAESVAAELGLGGVDSLTGAIRGNPKLQELGLGPLLDNHALKRELWDAAGLSLFHRVLPELGKAPNTKL